MRSELVQIKIERKYSIPKDLQPLEETLGGEKKTCVIVYPSKKYIPYIKHIIKIIEEVMRVLNIEVKTLSEDVKPQGSNSQTILELLENCILGIVILDGLRPNVVLEYGMLLALKKSIIVLKDENAKIDIKNLDDNLKSKIEEYNIDNPELDIDKHLSDVKDLHYTSYNWKDPEKFKEILEENLVKIKDKILAEITKPMITTEVQNLYPETYEKFQKAFNKLAEYSVRFISPTYDKVKELDQNISKLAEQSALKLNYTYYFQLADIYYDLSSYEEALEAFDRAIELKPDYYDAWNNKGIALGELNRYEEALKAFDEVIELEPDDAKAWNNKGIALGELGRYEEELKTYDKVIELKPDYADAWYNKGVVLGGLNRYKEALKAFDEVIELKPDDAKAWNNKGIALGKLGRYKEALKAFDRAIELKPDDADAWHNKGMALVGLGRYKEALKAFDRAIELKPDDADTWNNKGVVLGELGRYEEALKAYDKVIELKPDDAKAWYNKACCYSLRGDKKSALKNLSEAIKLDAKFKEEAKKDDDFKNLWDDEDFKKVIG